MRVHYHNPTDHPDNDGSNFYPSDIHDGDLYIVGDDIFRCTFDNDGGDERLVLKFVRLIPDNRRSSRTAASAIISAGDVGGGRTKQPNRYHYNQPHIGNAKLRDEYLASNGAIWRYDGLGTWVDPGGTVCHRSNPTWHGYHPPIGWDEVELIINGGKGLDGGK